MGLCVDWTLIGGLASVVTLSILVWQEIRARRLRLHAEWRIGVISVIGVYKVRLTNTGDIAARDVTVYPRNCEHPKKLPGWMYPSIETGTTEMFEVKGIGPDSWVQVVWKSPHHKNRYRTTWRPALTEGAAADEHLRQQLLSPGQALLARVRYGRAVGPGLQLTATLPRDVRKVSKMAERLAQRAQKRSSRR